MGNCVFVLLQLLVLSKVFIHVYVNMDKHNQYVSSKQDKPIVNSHKYNLFGNNGHFYIKQQSRERERERELELENFIFQGL